jgi:hypothetical protein
VFFILCSGKLRDDSRHRHKKREHHGNVSDAS